MTFSHWLQEKREPLAATKAVYSRKLRGSEGGGRTCAAGKATQTRNKWAKGSVPRRFAWVLLCEFLLFVGRGFAQIKMKPSSAATSS
jgi:hypothetical protein